MIIHNFDPVLIDLGIFQIRWYSLAYILGILIGWIYANKIIKLTSNNKYNFSQVTTKHFDDLIIYLIIGIIVGGRLGYVIFYNLDYYSENLSEIFKLWQGGMSFHGGLIGVVISTIVFSKKFGINFFKFADIISCVAPIGIFLIFYSILRIFSEIFREPDMQLGLLFNFFSMGTLLSLLTIITGLLIILFIKKNEQNN